MRVCQGLFVCVDLVELSTSYFHQNCRKNFTVCPPVRTRTDSSLLASSLLQDPGDVGLPQVQLSSQTRIALLLLLQLRAAEPKVCAPNSFTYVTVVTSRDHRCEPIVNKLEEYFLLVHSADQQRPNIVTLTSCLTLLPILFIWFWYCSSLFPI